MKAIIQPSRLKGTLQAPASKSAGQRALAAALLHHGVTNINNIGNSEDSLAALQVIQDLGATVSISGEKVIVSSEGVIPVSKSINCGESGLSLRMFTAIAALCDSRILITGEGSLQDRPMNEFDNIFGQLGIDWESNNGKLPFSVQGPLRPVDISVDGSLSSQFITGLLMAYSAAGANAVIHVNDLKSRPYIDMTLQVMRVFGMTVPRHNDYKSFIFEHERKEPGKEQVINYTVEADWSAAAFLLVAGAIAGPVTIRGLDPSSAQADRQILDVLMRANAGIAIDAKGIVVHPSACSAFDFDATDCPDLFPPLVALAVYCEGESVITGVERLLHKESNRAVSLAKEFGKMGAIVTVDGNRMIISGGKKLKGAAVHSHDDHRIAMACAVAALGAEGETVISKAGAVRKSYPSFFRDLEKLGGSVSLNQKSTWYE
jgi:3-phosphoshikimate 1-carboxyvinyltransferase